MRKTTIMTQYKYTPQVGKEHSSPVENNQHPPIQLFEKNNSPSLSTQKDNVEKILLRRRLRKSFDQDNDLAENVSEVEVSEIASQPEGLESSLGSEYVGFTGVMQGNESVEIASLSGSGTAGVSGVGAGVTGAGLAGGQGGLTASLGMSGVAKSLLFTTVGKIAAGGVAILGFAGLNQRDNGDDTAPTVTAAQSFSYAENSSAGAAVGTVAATDNVGVTGYRFAETGTSTSADGFFSISDTGVVTLTAEGAAAGAASNDFETGANSFVYGIEARDAAGNWSSTVDVTFNVTDLPEVVLNQSFSYTENRQAGSFIGSVDVIASNGVVVFGFWDPATQMPVGNTSPDGFFTIDNLGRIFLTPAGAASYVNDAEDTETGGPLNSHQYYIQASDPSGAWSRPVFVTLNENNSRCDDSGLLYLIDEAGSGTLSRTLKLGEIYKKVVLPPESEESEEIEVFVSNVDVNKQLIRMISSGGDPSLNEVYLRLELFDIDLSKLRFLDEITCINLQASQWVDLRIDSDGSGDARNADNFMASLEKIFVSNRVADYLDTSGRVIIQLDNYGSSNWMPLLKDITVFGGKASINVSIDNRRESFSTLPRDDDRGDNFMQSLETIYLEGEGRVSLKVNNSSGDDFMKALTSITLIGGNSAFGTVTAEFDSSESKGLAISGGDNGYAEGFMEALEVITVINNWATDDATIKFNNSGGADDYMSKLSLINLQSDWREELYFTNNGGGANYIGALKEIRLENSTFKAAIEISNISRFDDEANLLRDASNFMVSLETIEIISQGGVKFSMVNDGSLYFLNEDYANPRYTDAGRNFLPSLKTINIEAGNSEDVEFDMVNVRRADLNDPTLSSMQSLSIKGGEIIARFDPSFESMGWIDFANIQGNSDREEGDFYVYDWANQLVVIGGFDAGSIDDKLNFSFGPAMIDDLGDLVFNVEDGNVRISYHENFGYSGSIVLLGVADTFVAAENIIFA
jgi:hypothetical protein